jgi:hypothetical protein
MEFHDDGRLTAEQIDKLLEAVGEDDADADADAKTEAADSGSEKKPEQESASKPDESTLDPSNAVILGKDGKYQIPYEKLIAAREKEKAAAELLAQNTAELAETKRQLAELRAQAEAQATVGNSGDSLETAKQAIAEGVDPGLFGDFSEAALQKGILTLVEQRVTVRVNEALEKSLKPIQTENARRANDEHLSAIYAKHGDADSLVESEEFDGWVKEHPSYARKAIAQVLQTGSSAEVNELFDRFKTETRTTGAGGKPALDANAVKTEAARVIEKAASATVPNSLSDIPGGKPGATATIEEKLAGISDPKELASIMESLSVDQLDAILNKI